MLENGSNSHAIQLAVIIPVTSADWKDPVMIFMPHKETLALNGSIGATQRLATLTNGK